MRQIIFILLVMFFLSIIVFPQNDSFVEIKTQAGNIKVELYNNKAPVTVSNFLRYVKAGKFRNSLFYRTVTMSNQPQNKIKIEVIQGGIEDTTKMFPAIKHESTKTTGILHKDGIISMARNEPGTETSEFFICIGDQPELDYGGKRNPDGQGFSAFGKVIDGMDVVRKIQKMHSVEQRLKPPVKIIDIVLLKK
jgi:peptidyl-prolyl cis-trans isomerase A (cyclophilin A)